MICSVNGRECVLVGRLNKGDTAYFRHKMNKVWLLSHRLFLSIDFDLDKLHHNFQLTEKFGH